MGPLRFDCISVERLRFFWESSTKIRRKTKYPRMFLKALELFLSFRHSDEKNNGLRISSAKETFVWFATWQVSDTILYFWLQEVPYHLAMFHGNCLVPTSP